MSWREFLGVHWCDSLTTNVDEGCHILISGRQWEALVKCCQEAQESLSGSNHATHLPSWLAGFERGSKFSRGSSPDPQSPHPRAGSGPSTQDQSLRQMRSESDRPPAQFGGSTLSNEFPNQSCSNSFEKKDKSVGELPTPSRTETVAAPIDTKEAARTHGGAA